MVVIWDCAALICVFGAETVIRVFGIGLLNLGKSQFYAFCAGAGVLIAFALPISLPGILLNLILIPVFSLVILPLSLVGLLYGLGLDDPKILDVSGAFISHIFQWLDHFQSGFKAPANNPQ